MAEEKSNKTQTVKEISNVLVYNKTHLRDSLFQLKEGDERMKNEHRVILASFQH